MAYRWLVTAVLVLHFGYLAYVVLGGFLAWRWPRTIVVHVLAAAWGFAVIAIPLDCPLTGWENWARAHAGQQVPTQGFIDRYIEGVLYPQRYTGLLRGLAAAVVLGSWVGFALRRRRARRRDGRPPAGPLGRPAGPIEAVDTTGKSGDSSGGAATV